MQPEDNSTLASSPFSLIVSEQEALHNRRISRRVALKGLAASTFLMSAIGCASSSSASAPVVTPTATPRAHRLGSVLYTYQGHADRVAAVAWSPDGKWIASGSLDKTVQVWAVPQSGNTATPFIYRGHSDGVTAVAWSPDSKRVVSGSLDKTVQVWAVPQGGNTAVPFIYRGHTEGVSVVAWSPDGKRIASGSSDKTVQVWEPSEGGEARAALYSYRGHTEGVNDVTWSPDGKRLATSSLDKTVQILDGATGRVLYTYRGHSASVTAAVWSPDSKYIASGSLDKTVQVWESATGRVLYTYRGYNVDAAKLNPTKGVLPDITLTVAWSHNGKRLAVLTQEYCGDVCGVVLVWDALTQRNVSFYPDFPIYALAWSPDDTRFVSAVGPTSAVQISQAT